jgi:cytochrome c oxidase subunit II
VRRRRWARRGSTALLLAAFAVLLTGCSAHDAERDMRFGWPTGITKQATEMRVLWTWSGVAALIVGAFTWGLIFWCCIRYRKKNDELPRQTKFNLPIELVYSLTPFLIIAGLFYRTVIVEDDVNKITKNPDVVVQVDAFKWNWQFEYQQVKGVTQAYAPEPGQASVSVPATTSGPGGRFLADPTTLTADPTTGQVKPGPQYLSTVGSDDEIPVLVIPVGAHVLFDEHSDDVIHSFWVPEFLFKRDVIPYGGKDNNTSRDNRFEIQATSTGSFVGRCAELCGTYHSEMNFEVRVVSQQTFQTYLTALAKYTPTSPGYAARQSLALAAAGMAPYATTTYPFNTDRSDRSASKNTGS